MHFMAAIMTRRVCADSLLQWISRVPVVWSSFESVSVGAGMVYVLACMFGASLLCGGVSGLEK